MLQRKIHRREVEAFSDLFFESKLSRICKPINLRFIHELIAVPMLKTSSTEQNNRGERESPWRTRLEQLKLVAWQFLFLYIWCIFYIIGLKVLMWYYIWTQLTCIIIQPDPNLLECALVYFEGLYVLGAKYDLDNDSLYGESNPLPEIEPYMLDMSGYWYQISYCPCSRNLKTYLQSTYNCCVVTII